jgi:ankyrin repeat protein
MSANSALGCAAENGHDDVCELLISVGADVNPAISENIFPLILAIENGHVSTSKLLLEHGANVHIKQWDKNLLTIANESRSPNRDLIALIEEHMSRSDTAPDPYSIDRLKCADSLNVFRIFSDDVPYIDPNLSYTDKSLFNEVRNFKVRSVSTLIKAGSNPNSIDPNGETPLFTAIRSMDYKTDSSIISVINLLIDAGADVNAIGYQGQPLLICALSSYGKEEAAIRLISAGAKVDVSHPRYGSSMYAASTSIEAMQALLSTGASIDGLGPNRFSNLPGEWTALMKLCAGYKTSIAEIKWLLEVGANPNARDHLGWTPLMIASWKREIEFVKALVTRGADIHAVNSDGMNALDLAMASRDLDLFNKKKNASSFEVDKLEIVDYLSNELGLTKAAGAI